MPSTSNKTPRESDSFGYPSLCSHTLCGIGDASEQALLSPLFFLLSPTSSAATGQKLTSHQRDNGLREGGTSCLMREMCMAGMKLIPAPSECDSAMEPWEPWEGGKRSSSASATRGFKPHTLQIRGALTLTDTNIVGYLS